MVLILDGYSEHVAHARRKLYLGSRALEIGRWDRRGHGLPEEIVETMYKHDLKQGKDKISSEPGFGNKIQIQGSVPRTKGAY